jgi:hypothetical protein
MKVTKYELHTYTVRGLYSFPIDMLRYDRSFPTDESETGNIATTIPFMSNEVAKEPIEIRLTGIAYPNMRRWDSFGWKVVEVDGVRVP